MSTIVRVKRRLEESPLEALVVHCKRARTEESEEITPSLFVFSGTLDEKDHTFRHIKKEWLKSYENSIESNSAKDAKELTSKLRQSQQNISKDQRLKILNLRRGIPLSSEVETEAANNSDCTVLDLHRYKDGQSEDIIVDDDAKYAYDLYISKEKDFDHNMLDDIAKIEFAAHNKDMLYRNENVKDSDEEMDPDEDDSNDENNWRNDYPDEENDGDSIGEDDMRDAMNRFTIDDDLSSDAGEEEAVYGNANSHDYSKYVGLSEDDINRYGLAYAKYKLKLLRPAKEDDDEDVPKLIEYCSDRSHGSSDDNNSEGDSSEASYKDAHWNHD